MRVVFSEAEFTKQLAAVHADLFKRKGDKSKVKENLTKAINILKECGAVPVQKSLVKGQSPYAASAAQ